MGRERRPLAAGAYYHVSTAGNNHAPIVIDDTDRHTFIRILNQVVHRYGWKLHAQCLMGNHYHLIVETPLPNLSDGMRDLNTLLDPSGDGWSLLEATRVNNAGQILVTGTHGGVYAAALLTPVPEPAGAAVLRPATVALFRRRR